MSIYLWLMLEKRIFYTYTSSKYLSRLLEMALYLCFPCSSDIKLSVHLRRIMAKYCSKFSSRAIFFFTCVSNYVFLMERFIGYDGPTAGLPVVRSIAVGPTGCCGFEVVTSILVIILRERWACAICFDI